MSPSAIAKPAANRLLMRLPRADRQRFIAQCETVDVAISDVLSEQGDRVRYVYFPIDCFLSLITPVADRGGFEVGMVGSEGMQGISLTLGVAVAPQCVLVQGAGSTLRMTAATFRRELKRSAPLQRVLARYLHVLMTQLAQTGACTRFHQLEERLARWLLMTDDRAPGHQLRLTHEFLAYMLGMRRVGITTAAGALQKKKLISYVRGIITIKDRSGLEDASCECYRIDQDTYAEMLGA